MVRELEPGAGALRSAVRAQKPARHARAAPDRQHQRFEPAKEALVDHFTHHQDIRRPLGLPRELPTDRLLAALDAAPGIGGLLKAKGRAKGLRFVASDLDWSWGDGPEVKGNAEAILLALGGRPSVLDELGGDGLPALRERLAA